MNMRKRIERLEKLTPTPAVPFRFILAPLPPAELTGPPLDAWRAEQARQDAAAGIETFTLDLGAATVREGDGE